VSADDRSLRAIAPYKWTSETNPRGKFGPLTKAEREFREALQSEHIPRASALLKAMIDRGIKGDTKAAAVAFKVMGLIRKDTDDAQIQEIAQKLLDGMIEEVRARRAANDNG
jgi:hypothetical protein